ENWASAPGVALKPMTATAAAAKAKVPIFRIELASERSPIRRVPSQRVRGHHTTGRLPRPGTGSRKARFSALRWVFRAADGARSTSVEAEHAGIQLELEKQNAVHARIAPVRVRQLVDGVLRQ